MYIYIYPYISIYIIIYSKLTPLSTRSVAKFQALPSGCPSRGLERLCGWWDGTATAAHDPSPPSARNDHSPAPTGEAAWVQQQQKDR